MHLPRKLPKCVFQTKLLLVHLHDCHALALALLEEGVAEFGVGFEVNAELCVRELLCPVHRRDFCECIAVESRLVHRKFEGVGSFDELGDFVGGAVGDNPAFVDDDHAVGYCLHLRQDMGGEDDGFVLADFLDEVADFDNLVGVKPGGGFVKDKHFGVVYECLRQAHALAVAFGKHAYFFVLLYAQTRHLYDFGYPCGEFLLGNPLYFAGKLQKLLHIHVQIQGVMLRQIANFGAHLQGMFLDVVVAYLDAAGGGRYEAGHNLHGRGFARAIRTQKTEDFALFDGKREVLDGSLRAIHFGQPRDLNKHKRILSQIKNGFYFAQRTGAGS